MLLAADVGNTNVVFALIDQGEIKARWRIASDPRRTGDEYAVWLLQLAEFQGFDSGDIDQVIIGSVVPRAIHNLTVLSEKYLGITPLIAGQGAAEWGFELDIEERLDLARGRIHHHDAVFVVGDEDASVPVNFEAVGLAVIVDGETSQLGMLQKVQENSEVHFLPAIAGG